MSDLKAIIARQIAQSGPMPLSEYMGICLQHPSLGYYTRQDPLGAQGDFTTAPEISQMFGEMVGLCIAQSWLDQGAPSPFVLAEAGPGRGTLMADILRVTKSVPGFHAAMRLCLVETSPALREKQAQSTAPHSPDWFDSIADLPEGPLFFVANEFIDALPIRQYERVPQGWSERMVAMQGEQLGFARAKVTPQPALDAEFANAPLGTIVESCPSALPMAAEIGDRLSRFGGVALIIDYGDWDGVGDTFQALENHEFADPFANPGAADLTAHVRFAPLAKAAEPARHAQMLEQGEFLMRLGMGQRARSLAGRAPSETQARDIANAFHRLTHVDEMGKLFKVLALYAPDAPPPPGFDPIKD